MSSCPTVDACGGFIPGVRSWARFSNRYGADRGGARIRIGIIRVSEPTMWRRFCRVRRSEAPHAGLLGVDPCVLVPVTNHSRAEPWFGREARERARLVDAKVLRVATQGTGSVCRKPWELCHAGRDQDTLDIMRLRASSCIARCIETTSVRSAVRPVAWDVEPS